MCLIKNRNNDFLISGYYGCENFGDDLTLECMMHHLDGKRGAILTCNPAKTKVPSSVKKIHRFSMKEIHHAMKETKVFLMGCGSLFQDTTSFRSFIYYYVIMRMALHNKCKTMLYANGIGPINRNSNRRRMKFLLKRIDYITVRDQKSYELLKFLGRVNNVFITADDSFSYPIEKITPKRPSDKANNRTLVGLNLRIDENIDQDALNQLAATLQSLAQEHQLYYYLIPFHYEQDSKMLKRLASLLTDVGEFIDAGSDPHHLLPYIASTKLQISERLHGQILSTILGIPFLPISYDPKINSFARQVGMEEYLLEHQDFNCNSFKNAFEKVYRDHLLIQEKLTSYTQSAREKVRLNRELLLRLIEEK